MLLGRTHGEGFCAESRPAPPGSSFFLEGKAPARGRRVRAKPNAERARRSGQSGRDEAPPAQRRRGHACARPVAGSADRRPRRAPRRAFERRSAAHGPARPIGSARSALVSPPSSARADHQATAGAAARPRRDEHCVPSADAASREPRNGAKAVAALRAAADRRANRPGPLAGSAARSWRVGRAVVARGAAADRRRRGPTARLRQEADRREAEPAGRAANPEEAAHRGEPRRRGCAARRGEAARRGRAAADQDEVTGRQSDAVTGHQSDAVSRSQVT
mmetsp:Transcript_23033/g.69195  ORF Transcript_23033/g.69195 Transcript_23033/m.69195 type:complete len:277 (-) Transcript_23033:960-1790(-)